MSLNLNKYLKELKQNKNYFEEVDINGKREKNVLKKNFRCILITFISIVIVYNLDYGFNKDFISLVSTILSILIGLFTTSIIFVFDKLYIFSDKKREEYEIIIKNNNEIKENLISIDNKSQQTSSEKLKEVQTYNYFIQFVYIIGYNIVLCIYVLLLLLLNSLFYEFMKFNIFDYKFCINNLRIDLIINFFIVGIIVLYRFLVLYWTLNIMYNTLYAISSMVNFITKKKIND